MLNNLILFLQTSHDGADSTSITSGIENELKKAGSNINKIKKSSIKRKVPSFSHESDDGIIEPLLQTDKEKSDIASRSAKFLLQKSKTDSSYEKDSKNVEDYVNKCSISTPVQQANQLITNNIKENPPSTPYICGMAPIHNYMNTNIFSTYDLSKGITTKSPILVEIDGSKSGVYSPSPLIFTTAKIHTDSKTKLMEPLQVTPVPILSTIEGSVVRAGALTNSDKITSVPQSQESITNISGKFDKIENRPAKGKQAISSASNYVSPSVEIISNNKIEYQTKVTNESVIVKSLASTTDYIEKNQTVGQLNLDAGGLDINLSEKSKKCEVLIPTVKSHIETVSKAVKPIETIKTTITKATTENITDKTKSGVSNEDCRLAKVQQQQVDTTKSSISIPFEIKVTNMSADKISSLRSTDQKMQEAKVGNTDIEKSFTSSKKLQRQKNASIQDIQDLVTTGEISKTTKSNENVISTKENKNIEQKMVQEKTKKISNQDKSPSTTIVTSYNFASPPPSTSTLTKNIASSSLVSTSNVMVLTTPIDLASCKTSGTSSSKVIPHSTSKCLIVSPDSSIKNITKLSSLTPVATTSTASVLIRSAPEKSCGSKPDIGVSQSAVSSEQVSKGEKSVKCSSPIVSTTTLPSYIVSTSKTKIGSTFTSNTNTSTTKSQSSSPLAETVFTTSSIAKSSGAQQSVRPIVGISPTNGTKHPNFSKQTQSDTVKKDGRA